MFTVSNAILTSTSLIGQTRSKSLRALSCTFDRKKKMFCCCLVLVLYGVDKKRSRVNCAACVLNEPGGTWRVQHQHRHELSPCMNQEEYEFDGGNATSIPQKKDRTHDPHLSVVVAESQQKLN